MGMELTEIRTMLEYMHTVYDVYAPLRPALPRTAARLRLQDNKNCTAMGDNPSAELVDCASVQVRGRLQYMIDVVANGREGAVNWEVDSSRVMWTMKREAPDP